MNNWAPPALLRIPSLTIARRAGIAAVAAGGDVPMIAGGAKAVIKGKEKGREAPFLS